MGRMLSDPDIFDPQTVSYLFQLLQQDGNSR